MSNVTNNLHPTQTPEYWEDLARSERAFAKEDRARRFASVESILLHEAKAKEYDLRAAAIRKEAP